MVDLNKLDIFYNMKKQFQLDNGIAELVYHFNRLGFKTIYSCQGHTEIQKPYIMFDSDEESLHCLIKEIYKNFGREKNLTYKKYLDIGNFYKLCSPIIEQYSLEITINSHWMWSGEYWLVNDYQNKIDKFCKFLQEIKNYETD